MRKWQFGVGGVLKSVEIDIKNAIWCGMGCIFYKKVSVSCGSGDSGCRGVQARASLFSSLGILTAYLQWTPAGPDPAGNPPGSR